MAELTLKTRLLNKYNQSIAADAILGKGEIHFEPITIPLGKDGATETAVLMKVGDGQTAYENLEYTAARAADVYDWAKAANKPEYQASEIKGLGDFISGKIQDTNTTYAFAINDNGELVISSHDVDGTNATVATLDLVTPAELNAKLGSYVTSANLTSTLANYVSDDEFELFKGTNTTEIANAKKAGTDAAAALNTYKSANDTALAGVKATADAAAVKADVDAALADKADKATTLAGYGITDAMTATAIESAISVAKTEAIASATYDDTKVKADIQANATAIANEEARAKAAEQANATAAANAASAASEVAGKVATIESDYLTSDDKLKLEGDISDVKTTADAAKEAIDAFLLDAEVSGEAINTLKEIQAELALDDEGAAAMLARIKTLEDVDNATQAELDSAVNTINAALDKKAAAADVNGIASRVQTLENAGHVTATEIAAAKTEAINAAAADATTKANQALADAKTYADQAKTNAIATAAEDATAKANQALADAKAYANGLSHEDTTYTAGTGLVLNGTVFSIDPNLVLTLDANA